jgi:hypothetical protein
MNDDYKDALIEKIHTWTYDVLNDDEKLNAYIGFPAGNRYPIERIPSEKQIALDELFGVK